MKKNQDAPKWTKRNKHAISIVKVTKREGKLISKEVLYRWDKATVETYRMSIGFFRGLMAGWHMFSNEKTYPRDINYPALMEIDGYYFESYGYCDFHGKNGEDIGSGVSYRLEKKGGNPVTGKDAWPKTYNK